MKATADQYGVVGHPIAHSWSPFIHGLFAQQTGQNLTYRPFDVPPEQFRRRVKQFFARGGRGLNVTVPHKLAAAELADELTPRAARAGAVNTLAARSGSRLLGDNTDGAGLVRDLRENLKLEIAGRRVLILGAGGAVRGVLAPLLALEPAALVLSNRTAERAQALAAEFADLGAARGCGFEALESESFDLVINATSASLGGQVPPVPASVLREDTFCYDMAYGRTATPFELWARARGCARTAQGWGMLVEQAAESFGLWRGVRPRTAPVLAALAERAALSAS